MEKRELSADMTMGELVILHPATMPMLDALGIDFCCGGRSPLSQAALLANLPIEKVLAVMRATITLISDSRIKERDWQNVPLEELMEQITIQHQSFILKELPKITELMTTVIRVHGSKYGDILTPLAKIYIALRTELSDHLADEEENYFPLIHRLIAGDRDKKIALALNELEHVHDVTGAALAKMRALTQYYQLPSDADENFHELYHALQELESNLHLHVHLGNNILFPRTRALLHG